jgi:hypothetical protein
LGEDGVGDVVFEDLYSKLACFFGSTHFKQVIALSEEALHDFFAPVGIN